MSAQVATEVYYSNHAHSLDRDAIRRELFEATRTIDIPEYWESQYASESVTYSTKDRKRVIKATTEMKIYIDKCVNGEWKSEVYKCTNTPQLVALFSEQLSKLSRKKNRKYESLATVITPQLETQV